MECKLCDCVYEDSAALENHMKIHVNSFIMDICGKGEYIYVYSHEMKNIKSKIKYYENHILQKNKYIKSNYSIQRLK